METRNDIDHFVIIKFVICLSVVFYAIGNKVKPFWSAGPDWFLVAIFIFFTIMLELQKDRRKQNLLCCGIILVALLFHYRDLEPMRPWIIIFLCDLVACYRLNFCWCGLSYVLLVKADASINQTCLFITLLLIIYYQNNKVIKRFRDYMNDYDQEEFQLKENLDLQKQLFNRELEQKNLYAENRILEERDHLFQQLHDRLGHSINGSIYQLEAAKVLLDTKPQESKQILQMVIDHLRGSMDEIRKIFRKEKPSKKQMAIIGLIELCEKCKEKYGIITELHIEGEKDRIPDGVLEVILDNTYEAISNALKYSKCTHIWINITVLNQRIRCEIRDNGNGCEEVIEGMGIQGMKKRVRSLNGIIDLRGETGFEITMLFPITEEESKNGTN
ncbi:sensor histidine kinase [Anaerosporobacter faecicola]|uniref:sensor histidine kinase n=1 Tax=Anaerosporobacter faecicola TaxID=2718714 RepID=UPI00143C93EF|nr:histidine kinase [Anaerosporobacter faecicola]